MPEDQARNTNPPPIPCRVGFSRGLNDTPKMMALLVAAAWTGLNPRVSLVFIALFMAAGGVLHSRRIARTMGERITTMNPGQGLLANLVASGLVIGASSLIECRAAPFRVRGFHATNACA